MVHKLFLDRVLPNLNISPVNYVLVIVLSIMSNNLNSVCDATNPVVLKWYIP